MTRCLGTLVGAVLVVLLASLLLAVPAADAQSSAAFETLDRDLKAGLYRQVWTEAERSENAQILALGADAATSEVFCGGYDETGRPILDKAIALAERAGERDPSLAEAWLQFARAKGGWLRNYAFTPELLQACTDSFSRFSNLFKVPRLLSLKSEAKRVAEAFHEALGLEPANGVALVGLGATELLEPLHPCVDDYTQEKGEAALRRMAQGLATPGRPQLKSFIAAEALQEAHDSYGLPKSFFMGLGLDLDALWRRAAEPCDGDAFCRCMAGQAGDRLLSNATR